MTLRPTKFDSEVLALDVADFIQTLTERGNERGPLCARRARDKPDCLHCRFLRARDERCGEETTRNTADEHAPIDHGITSSARSSTSFGIVSPSALAQLEQFEPRSRIFREGWLSGIIDLRGA